MTDGSSLAQSAGGSGGVTLRPVLNHRSDEDDDSQNEEAGDVSGGRRRRREAERSTQHSPTGEKIAKDTGCCLYSAISVVVVMLVSIGIVLIVTGPVLGLSIFPPLLKQHQPVRQQQLEHNHLYNINDSSLHTNNESVSQEMNEPHRDVVSDEENYEWLTMNYQSTEESVTHANSNDTIEEMTSTEDLENLSPEALRLNRKGYVAYVPVPLKDHVEIDDYISGSSRERLDWMNTGDDVVGTRTGYDFNSRHRPETNDKLLLPIVIVPNDDNDQETESQSPLWRTNQNFADANVRNVMMGNRRLNDENDDEYHPNSGSVPLPTSNQHLFRRPLHSEEETTDDESDPVDNLYRMFGTLAPEQRNGRPRNGGNNRHRDDYGQRTRLPPPPRSRRPPPRRFNGKGGRRGGGPPPRQIRPPPKQSSLPSVDEQSHRITSRYPQNNWGPAVDYTDPQGYQQESRPANGGGLRPERIRKTKPLYSYPSDAMSIQDIINYMTAMGNSETSDNSKSVHDSSTNRQHHGGGYHTTADIDHPSVVYQLQNSQRSGHGHGHSSIGRPINTGLRQQQQQTAGASPAPRNNHQQPYSFMLDVYPVKDSTTSTLGGSNLGGPSSTRLLGATSGATIVLPPPPPAHRQQLQQHQQQQQQYISNSQNYHYNSAEEPHSFRSQPLQPEVYRPRPSFNQQQQFSSHLAPTADDHLLLPIPYRPTARPQLRAPPTDDPNKPKLVVHLNVYNQKGQAANTNPRYYSEERYDDADDVYYSPSDVYRAVLRNNAAKRDQYLQAGDDMGGIGGSSSYNRADDGLSGGQSRVGGISHRITNEDVVGHPSSSLSSGVLHHDVGTFRNHQMDDSNDQQHHSNNNNNKQQFYNNRNFYPDDDIPEPLPFPMTLIRAESSDNANADNSTATSTDVSSSSSSTTTAAPTEAPSDETSA